MEVHLKWTSIFTGGEDGSVTAWLINLTVMRACMCVCVSCNNVNDLHDTMSMLAFSFVWERNDGHLDESAVCLTHLAVDPLSLDHELCVLVSGTEGNDQHAPLDAFEWEQFSPVY